VPVLSAFWNEYSTKGIKNKESTIYVVGNSHSVVIAVVGWILWWLCNDKPDSPVAGSSGRGSGT
jgi:hypothetical protein